MATPKVIIITAADALYCPLAHDVFASVRAQTFDMPIALGMLDVGLDSMQREHFVNIGVQVETVGVDIDFPGRATWVEKKPGIRALMAKPFLRRYFPGFDIYIWLDADVWVQTPDAINAMITATLTSDAVCIAAEIDRCYTAFFESDQIWRTFHGWYESCYPGDIAGKMALRPMLNVGVLAMNKNSPVWDAWAQIYTETLQNTPQLNEKTFMAEQLGLNILLYLKGLPCVVLPASYNWLTYYALPKLDKETGLYVEPQVPHRVISQFHLTRPNKLAVEKIECTDGSYVERPMTFSAAKK